MSECNKSSLVSHTTRRRYGAGTGSESFKSAALSELLNHEACSPLLEFQEVTGGSSAPSNGSHTAGWDPEATLSVFNCHTTKSEYHAPPPPPPPHTADFWGRYK